MWNDAYDTKWPECSWKDGAIVVRLIGKANTNRNFAWDLSTLVFTPVEKENCIALKVRCKQSKKPVGAYEKT